MKVPGNKRRILLIDRVFQFRLVGLGVVSSLIAVGIFAAGLFGPVILELHQGGISDPEVQAAAEQFLTLHLRVWPPLLAALALLTLHHIVVSHRIAGPLYRIRTTLEAMATGNISTRIVIRKKDYLAKEVSAVNELLAFLREQINGLDDDGRAVDAAAAELYHAVDSASAEEVRRKTQQLDTCMRQFKLRLKRFRTERAAAASTKQTLDQRGGALPCRPGHQEREEADELVRA